MTLTLDRQHDPVECEAALTAALVLNPVIKVASGVFEVTSHQYVDGCPVPRRYRVVVEQVK